MNIERGDARQGVPWGEGSIHCVVTSPPYWGLRAYGDNPAELGGSGESRLEYLHGLVKCMRHMREAMDDAALAWVNIADTASGSGGAGGDYNTGGDKEGRARWRQGDSGYKPMTWCNIPGTFADLMLLDGWLLRASIVWDKGVERREALSHIRRVRPAHEWIFCFAKNRGYHWDHDALTETGSVWHFADETDTEGLSDVWHFAPGGKGTKHQAPFPEELPRRCIAASGLSPGMVVADPFAGSGTTLRVAEEMGYKGVGLDLYAE